jgi:hypothetical protein
MIAGALQGVTLKTNYFPPDIHKAGKNHITKEKCLLQFT